MAGLETFHQVWGLVAELATAMDAVPMSKHRGLWQCVLDDEWVIAVNGHAHDIKLDKGGMVPSWSIYVEYNGWPAGIIDPGGGVIAAGAAANERTFLAALERRVEQGRG